VENSAEFDILSDGWTALSSTRDWSAQFEHTILVTSSGVEVLTDDPDDPVKM
jgi:methionyl aminopeptidase